MCGSVGPLLGIGVLGVLLSSCGDDCAAGAGICIPEWAVRVVISGPASSGPVQDIVVRVSGAVDTAARCNIEGNETVCMVWGPGGTYVLEVSAPGFQSAQRTVTVRDSMECGCRIVATERVEFSLVKN